MEKIKNKFASFSLLEIIVAVALFTIFAATLATITLGVRSDYEDGSDRIQANFLLIEGLEAVRSIRDQDWSNLTAGDHGVFATGGAWAFTGTGTTIGSFQRHVTLTEVSSSRFDVEVTLSWYTDEGFYMERSVTSRLTNWILTPITAYAMAVYDAQDVSSIPKYRVWDGSGWSAEASASEVGGDARHMVLKYAPTRDEAILATLGSTGALYVQVYEGTGNTWGTPFYIGDLRDTNGDGDQQSLFRGFDLEYEQSSGDAMIIYGDGTADPNYRLWNGTNWSGENDANIPTTGIPVWIEMAARPGSDELAAILVDANDDVVGLRWDGSSPSSMGAGAAWDTSSSPYSKKVIDVAFETTSGDILFIWADSVSTDQYYRAYSGGSLGAATLLDNAQAGGVGEWVKLAANPTSGSNQIMFGVQDAGLDLNTFMWSGSAWSAVHGEHDATVEDITDMNFDIIFETHASNADDAWLVWGDGATVSRKLWNGPTSAWAAASTSGDDTAFVQLAVNSNNEAVLTALYEDDTSATDDLTQMNLTGGSQTWSSPSSIWSGPVTTNFRFTKMQIAAQTYNSSNEAMLVYNTQTVSTTPKYRLWDGSAASDQYNATEIGGEIRHIAVKMSPTRNEAIMVVMGSTGSIQAQTWSGSVNSWSDVTILGEHIDTNGSGDAQSLYRGFDVEYEQSSGDAIVVFGDGTADPNYRVWDGSSWSAASDINIPTTGRPHWIEMSSRPGSDEMAFISIDFNVDVYGMRWTGSAWSDMGDAVVWDVTGSNEFKKSIDVAFEKTSGDIMFIWGDSVSTDQYYRAYSGGSLSAATLLDNPNAGGINHWVRLASNLTSSSDEIMYGVLDAGADLNTFMWSGTGWSAVHSEHDATTEDIADMNFDIIFETHSSNADDAWLVWGDAATVSRKLWDGPTDAWGAATTNGDDTAVVVITANPDNGDVLASLYEHDTSASDDLIEMGLTGGSQTWAVLSTMWTGPVARPFRYFRVAADSSPFNTP